MAQVRRGNCYLILSTNASKTEPPKKKSFKSFANAINDSLCVCVTWKPRK